MENKISWKALEYKRKEKTADWYWAVILMSLAIIVTSFIMHNVFFAILILISTIILVSFSIVAPKVVEISMNQKGIKVGKDLYPFATLESFWVESTDDEENSKILLRSKKVIMPLIVIPIEEHHPLDIREFLLQYLKEVEMHESFSQKIMERLGF